MIPREYAREALKRGLQYEEQLGVNPFKFGLVGSTDSHTSLATTTEDNYFGKASAAEPSDDPGRFNEMITGYLPDPQGRDYSIHHVSSSASGLAAVWARENTREALWDAMKRKEVFATSGTRLRVRVFAGWDFEEAEVDRWDFAKQGYSRGVPMGGDLRNAPEGQSPVVMVRAMRDPDGANLDRIQIIKGWTSSDGAAHERIFDVAVSDGRQIAADGRCTQPVGNTVDVQEASFSNSIGDPMLFAYWTDPDFDATLAAVWTDPDFDPKRPAAYYVRVLEIPTPRWSTFDSVRNKLPLPKVVPATIQERAWSSPIWYAPKKN